MNDAIELTRAEIKTARTFARRNGRFGDAADLAVMQVLREMLWRALNSEAEPAALIERAKEVMPLILCAKRSLATIAPARAQRRLTIAQRESLFRRHFGTLPAPPDGSAKAFAEGDIAAITGGSPDSQTSKPDNEPLT